MFRCSIKKIQWYIKKNLVQQIGEKQYKLMFQPKGKGHVGDDFYLYQKQTICCCCGSEEELQRHHVVPYCFRKYMEQIKEHSSHDILLLCLSCHERYEKDFASKLKKELSIKMKIDFGGKDIETNLPLKTVIKIRNMATSLTQYAQKLKINSRIKIKNNIKKCIGHELSEKELDYWSTKKTDNIIEYGQYVVDNTEDIVSFIKMWRLHFIETMNPKYLPKGWSVNKEIKI